MSHNIKAYKEVQPNSIKITVPAYVFGYQDKTTVLLLFLQKLLIDKINDIYIISNRKYLRVDVFGIDRYLPSQKSRYDIYLKFESEAEAIKWKLKHVT